MNQIGLNRRLVSEFIGSALLLAAFVGSGVMAEKLAGGNFAVALLANSVATAAVVYGLVSMLAPVSGAHLNPAITLVTRMGGLIGNSEMLAYWAAQILGAAMGVALVHVMYGLPVFQTSGAATVIPNLWLAELIATFGLVLSILGIVRATPDRVATAVSLYVLTAFWFTASINPAVTIARALTSTFDGIAWVNVMPLVAAQFAGALLAALTGNWLFTTPPAVSSEEK